MEEQDATETEINGAVTTADAGVADYSYENAAGTTVNVNVYATTDSDNVKAAKVADQTAALNKTLAEEQEDLAEAQSAVAAVSGLASAVSLYNTRVEAAEQAEQAQTTAQASLNGAVASYNTSNTGITVETNGTVTGLIVLDDDQLVLANNVTETTNPGITNVLNASIALEAAQAAKVAADDAIDAAAVAIGYLDFDATTDPKDAMAAAFRTAPANPDTLTQAQVQAELNALEAGVNQLESDIGTVADLAGLRTLLQEAVEAGFLTGTEAADFAADGFTAGQADAIETAYSGAVAGSEATDAIAALNTANTGNQFEVLENAKELFEAGNFNNGDVDFGSSPLTSAQITAQDALATIEANIAAFEEAQADLAAAEAVASDLEALNTAIEDAEVAFDDLDVETPITLEGTQIATAESDIFLLGENDATLINFGAQGEDRIFVGEDFTLAQLDANTNINTNVGDAAVLEIFAQQDGANTTLFVEGAAFAGSSTSTNEITEITLNGVTAADLTLENGFLSIA